MGTGHPCLQWRGPRVGASDAGRRVLQSPSRDEVEAARAVFAARGLTVA
jgi:hypothetical protein